LLCKRTWR